MKTLLKTETSICAYSMNKMFVIGEPKLSKSATSFQKKNITEKFIKTIASLRYIFNLEFCSLEKEDTLGVEIDLKELVNLSFAFLFYNAYTNQKSDNFEKNCSLSSGVRNEPKIREDVLSAGSCANLSAELRNFFPNMRLWFSNEEEKEVITVSYIERSGFSDKE